MAGQPTANVDLYTTNMQTDGEDYFDFERDLDNNWEKLDKRFGCIDVAILPNNWVGTQAPYSQTITATEVETNKNKNAANIFFIETLYNENQIWKRKILHRKFLLF